ncbi:hypothetical protein Dda_0750 [Drechslerella dactyloides]|uniref:Uncharacterized protein n=1 Tax=Drechslerella dactyloides TaxID=74499 RepID=A0AAD6J860_DREDA|nr:hypothetical protein Dda_0750 [Drechslerella dactyloides]
MMMQRLSRESLRIKPPDSAGPQSPIIYETSKQVKKAYSKKKSTTISEAERRRIERLRELDARAEKIRQKEERKKQNALKRKLKEEKEGPKKLVKLTSSQPELSKFFAAKKEQVAVAKGDCDDPDDFKEPIAQDVLESEDEGAQLEVKIKPEILAEKPIPDANAPLETPVIERRSMSFPVDEQRELECIANPDIGSQYQRAQPEPKSLDSSPGAVICHAQSMQSGRLIKSSQPFARLEHRARDRVPSSIASTLSKGGPQTCGPTASPRPGPTDIPPSSPPPVFANSQLSTTDNHDANHHFEELLSEWDETVLANLAQAEQEAEAATTKREEDDRFLETYRHETDYNDLDDNYDLQDDINFEYDEPTSPIRERANETREDEKELQSSQAYRMGLSDPAFDQLQEELDSRYEQILVADDGAYDCGEDIPSSFLNKAFEDDLKEL